MVVSLFFVIHCFSFDAQVFASEVERIDEPNHFTLQVDNINFNRIFWGICLVYQLDSDDPTVRPFIQEGRAMLPMRAALKFFNFDGPCSRNIDWNESEEKVVIYIRCQNDPSYHRLVAYFWIGSTTAVFYDDYGRNPEYVTIPAAPIIVNNRTYLPLRAVTNAIGDHWSVEWIPSSQGIVIYHTGFPPRTVVLPDGSTHSLQ